MLALFLALLPVVGSAATVAAEATGFAQGACTDHVCSCLKKCPPKKPAPVHRSCHGGDDGGDGPSNPLFQSAGCHHGDDSVGPVAAIPHLLPVGIEIDPGFASADAVSSGPARPLAGFRHLDLQPPKALL
jgi:hypothetical protein